MILADKIIKQRKQNGWSQEEFAEKMGVSRQAVSKWEGAQTVPELSKILLMAELFGVTTDYLLKDDIEDAEYHESEEKDGCRKLTLEDANIYLKRRKEASFTIAIATFMCIISPILLIILGGLSDMLDSFISEELAVGIGLTVMFVIVGAAVCIFLYTGFKNEDFSYLEHEYFEREYGVDGMVREKAKEFRHTYAISNTVATLMCIISPLPMILAGIFVNDIVALYMLGVMLFTVAIAVFIYIFVGVRWASYQRLLKNSEYSVPKDKNTKNIKKEVVEDIYWALVLAVYLIWSFSCSSWGISWIVWVISAPLSNLIPLMFKNNKNDGQ